MLSAERPRVISLAGLVMPPKVALSVAWPPSFLYHMSITGFNGGPHTNKHRLNSHEAVVSARLDLQWDYGDSAIY